MRKAENMKNRRSVIYFSAFPGPDLLSRDSSKDRNSSFRLSAFVVQTKSRRARAGRILHSAFIYLFMFITILGICVITVVASRGETGVSVQPIGESALDELIKNKDNLLIVSFMAAWCGPCIDELPALNNLYRKYKDQGLKVVGISIDLEGPGAIQPALNHLKIDFPVYWYGDQAIQKFKLTAIPLLLVIKQGEIVERLPGRRNEKFLDKRVQALIE
jgi:thiol-disulfide isomerase/thioredoxin